MSKRLKSSHWLDAYRSRLAAKLIPFYVTRKGDVDAGAIFIRVEDRTLYTPQYNFENDQREWSQVAQNEEIAAYLERLDRVDPDYWLLDVERHGDRELFNEGL